MSSLVAMQPSLGYAEPISRSLATAVKGTPDLMSGIRRGLADRKAGRVRPWKEIRQELKLG